jgi:hypothetical protein
MPYLGKSPSQGVRTRFQFTPNAGTTAINGVDANNLTLSFTDGNYVDVYLNGVMLKAGVDYNTTTANQVTLSSGTVASDVVDIVVYDTFSLFGGTLEGNVKVNNGTFNVTGAVDFDSTLNVDGVVTTDGATHDGDVTFTGANYNAVWDKSDNALEFGDNAKAVFGAGSDLIIQHDGSRSIIQDNGTGNLRIQANNLELKNADNSHDYVFCSNGGAVELYHNNSKKIETTSSGVTVSGYAYITENSGTTQLYLRSNYNSTGPAIQGATNHPLMFLTNNSEKMRIDTSGNLGIGTGSPSQLMEISSSSDPKIRINNSSTSLSANTSIGGLEFNTNDASEGGTGIGASIEAKASGNFGSNQQGLYLAFSTRDSGSSETNTERMRIDSSGNVGIGETSPDTLLHISGAPDNKVITMDQSGRQSAIGTYFSSGSTDSRIDFYVSNGNTDGTANKRVSIMGDGRVGIGTDSPQFGGSGETSLDVTGPILFRGAIVAHQTNAGALEYSGNLFKIRAYGASSGDGKISFRAGGGGGSTDVEAATIDGNGKLICFGTAVAYALEARNSNANPYGQFIQFTGGAPDNNTNQFLACSDNSTTRLQITADGDVQNHDNSYGSISDERIKQDIVDANSQWDDIKSIKVRNFKKKDDVDQYGDKAWTQIGVIAQEIETVSPKLIKESSPSASDIKHSAEFGTLYTKDDAETQDAVLYTSDDEEVKSGDKEVGDIKTPSTKQIGEVKEIKENVKNVSYSVLYMKAVKALQEAMTRIETLEDKVAKLEGA